MSIICIRAKKNSARTKVKESVYTSERKNGIKKLQESREKFKTQQDMYAAHIHIVLQVREKRKETMPW